MEYSIDAVAKKMIMVIAGLSVLTAAAGYFLFTHVAGNEDSFLLATILGVNSETAEASDAIPFIAGIFTVMCLNIAKVILMKNAVSNSLKREALAAQMYLKGQYFVRLVITAVVLCIVGYFHAYVQNDAGNPQYVNFMGAFFGIFTFPVSSYSMRFFFKDAMKDNPELYVKIEETDPVQKAIDDLKSVREDASINEE